MNPEDVGALVGGLIGLALMVFIWIYPIHRGIKVAKVKGLSPHWMWFGVHPLGGWIAFLIIRFGVKRLPCPTCGAPMKPALRFCPNCGQPVSSAASPHAVAPGPVEAEEALSPGFFRIHCLQCSRTLKVPTDLAGKKGRCPYCQALIEIPAQTSDEYSRALPVGGPAPARAPYAGLGPRGFASQGSTETCGLAVASLVLGLIPLTCLPSLLAIIFGHIALQRIDQSGGQLTGRRMALWGVVLGYIFTAVNIIYGIIVGVGAAGG